MSVQTDIARWPYGWLKLILPYMMKVSKNAGAQVRATVALAKASSR